MKTLLYVVLGFLVLLIAAVLVVPSFIDWSAYKDRITAQVEKVTGRAVVIEGDMSLDILPSPALSAQGVRVANVEGGSAPEMASVRGMRVNVRLAPLLQGRIQVESIVLAEPEILLEVLPDGGANWRFAQADGDAPGEEESGGFGREVQVDSFRVVDGAITYRNAVDGIEERVTGVNAELTADSLSGPFAVEGHFATRGVTARLEGGLGRWAPPGATPYNLSLSLPESGAQARLSGAISHPPEGGQSVRGSLRVQGPNLVAVLGQLGVSGPEHLARSFSIAGDIRADETGVVAPRLDLRLDGLSADASLEAHFETPVRAKAGIHVQRFDLDGFLAGSVSDGPAGDLGALSVGEGDSLRDFALPDGVNADLEVKVDAMVYRDHVIRQARIQAALAEGILTVHEAAALLPGSSDVSLTGRVGGGPEGPAFDGRVEAASDNLRTAMAWVGVDVDAVSRDRLRRFDFKSDVSGTPRAFTLSDIDLTIDTMHVTGGVAAALRERPGFGIGLSVDSLNIDSYLPRGDREAGDDPADATPGPLAEALAVLGDFDANLDLRAGAVSFRDETARDIRLDATLQRGSLTVREARVGDLAGGDLILDGTLRDFLTVEPELDTNLTISVRDLGQFGRMAGVAAHWPEDVGTVSLAGTLTGGLDDLDVDLTLDALDGLATAQGRLAPLEGPARFDLNLNLVHESAYELAARLSGAPPIAAERGGIDLSARFSGTATEMRLQDLAGHAGPVEIVQGAVEADLAGARPFVRAELDTGDVPADVLAVFGGAGAGLADAAREGGSRDRGGWSDAPLNLAALRALDGELSMTSASIALSEAIALDGAVIEAALSEGMLDLSRLSGTLFGGEVAFAATADASGDVPAFQARLHASDVDSGPLLTHAADFDRVAGPISLDMNLAATGRSERALIRDLTGEGTMTGSLTVRARREEAAARLMLDLLGERVRELRGMAEMGGTVFDAFAGQESSLEGRVAVREGVARTDDTRLTSPRAEALLTGNADLVNWRTDARVDLRREQDPADGDPYLTVVLRGPLDRPAPTIRGAPLRVQEPAVSLPDTPDLPSLDPPAISRFLFDRFAPAGEAQAEPPPPRSTEEDAEREPEPDPEPEAEPEAEPEQPRRPSAEEIIRGILGGD